MMSPESMDAVFQALASATRREMLDIVRNDPGLSVGAVAQRFDVSRVAVMRHGRLHRYNTASGETSETALLEQEFAAFTGAKYCLAVASGGYAIATALRRKGQIEAVFLTHFHSDHIDGLGELMMQRWVNGTHTTPLPVYGPAGTEKIVAGFNLAYQQDAVYRVAHHGAATVPPGGEGGKAEVFGRISPLAMEVVYAKGDDLTVEAFNVEHSPIEPAIGYKVTYKDRSIVISGDTIKSAMVQKASQGVDVLIHEALSHELVMVLSDAAAEAGRDNLVKITKDILDYHTSPVEAAEVAQAAGVGMLLFSHIVPPLPVAPLKGIFLRGVSDAYDGPVVIGEDGTFVSLPAGSDVIETGNLK